MLDGDEPENSEDFSLASKAIKEAGILVVPELKQIITVSPQTSKTKHLTAVLRLITNGRLFANVLPDRLRRHRAARALSLIKPEGVACLTNLLNSRNQEHREWAVYGLGKTQGVRTQSNIQDLLIETSFADKSSAVRTSAMEMLSYPDSSRPTNRLVEVGLHNMNHENKDGTLEQVMAAKLLMSLLIESTNIRESNLATLQDIRLMAKYFPDDMITNSITRSNVFAELNRMASPYKDDE